MYMYMYAVHGGSDTTDELLVTVMENKQANTVVTNRKTTGILVVVQTLSLPATQASYTTFQGIPLCTCI